MNKYLITIGNSTDLDGICYSQGFRQQLYICGVLDTPVINVQDDIKRNNKGCDVLYSSVQIQYNEFVFCDVLDEQLTALKHVELVDDVQIFDFTNNCSYKPTELKIDSSNQGDQLFNKVTLRYDTAKCKTTNCCNNAYVNRNEDCLCDGKLVKRTDILIEAFTGCTIGEANTIDVSQTITGDTECCGSITFIASASGATINSISSNGIIDFTPNGDNWYFDVPNKCIDLGAIPTNYEVNLNNYVTLITQPLYIQTSGVCTNTGEVIEGCLFECQVEGGCNANQTQPCPCSGVELVIETYNDVGDQQSSDVSFTITAPDGCLIGINGVLGTSNSIGGVGQSNNSSSSFSEDVIVECDGCVYEDSVRIRFGNFGEQLIYRDFLGSSEPCEACEDVCDELILQTCYEYDEDGVVTFYADNNSAIAGFLTIHGVDEDGNSFTTQSGQVSTPIGNYSDVIIEYISFLSENGCEYRYNIYNSINTEPIPPEQSTIICNSHMATNIGCAGIDSYNFTTNINGAIYNGATITINQSIFTTNIPQVEVCCGSLGICEEFELKYKNELITATDLHNDTPTSGTVTIDLNTLIDSLCGAVTSEMFFSINANATISPSNVIQITPTSSNYYSVRIKSCCVNNPECCATYQISGFSN